MWNYITRLKTYTNDDNSVTTTVVIHAPLDITLVNDNFVRSRVFVSSFVKACNRTLRGDIA